MTPSEVWSQLHPSERIALVVGALVVSVGGWVGLIWWFVQ